jgi:hypothetical protein
MLCETPHDKHLPGYVLFGSVSNFCFDLAIEFGLSSSTLAPQIKSKTSEGASTTEAT